MPSAKQPTAKPAATIAEATARTRSVIEDLQARLTGAAQSSLTPRQVESFDDLERELQAYFEHAAPTHGPETERNQRLNELRNRVIEGVVDRIIAEWSISKPNAPHCLGLGREVMDRLVERVLEELRKTAAHGSTHK